MGHPYSVELAWCWFAGAHRRGLECEDEQEREARCVGIKGQCITCMTEGKWKVEQLSSGGAHEVG